MLNDVTPSVLSAVAFEPDYRTALERNDRGFETSINWEDDEEAVEVLLRNKQIAGHGAARLARSALDTVNHLPSLRPYAKVHNDPNLTYERNPLPDNVYHGNIIFSGRLPKPLIRMIAGHLAMQAEYIDPDHGIG